MDYGYFWACLVDEPRHVSHVAVISSSYYLIDVSIRSRGHNLGLQLHSSESPNRCRVQTVTERLQTFTERAQTFTGYRLQTVSQRVQKVTEMVQNVTERVQQSILASLCLILYLPHLIQAVDTLILSI